MVQKQLEFRSAAAVILRLLRDSPYSPVGRVYLRNYIKFSRLTGGLGGIRKSRGIRNRFVITFGYEHDPPSARGRDCGKSSAARFSVADLVQ